MQNNGRKTRRITASIFGAACCRNRPKSNVKGTSLITQQIAKASSQGLTAVCCDTKPYRTATRYQDNPGFAAGGASQICDVIGHDGDGGCWQNLVNDLPDDRRLLSVRWGSR
jgi:hypothetical protein